MNKAAQSAKALEKKQIWTANVLAYFFIIFLQLNWLIAQEQENITCLKTKSQEAFAPGEQQSTQELITEEQHRDEVLDEDKASLAPAQWSIMNYIQADNDLAPFADLNLQSMKDGMLPTGKVNIIIVWDKPTENKTNRLKVTAGTVTDDGSSLKELGINPKKELISHFERTAQKYPAEHYGLILWDHGSGSVDYAPGEFAPRSIEKGILYDYTHETFLNNQDLEEACKKSSDFIGKKIDFVGMDACFMAMLETAYQIKDYADYLVASEETEPSLGWGYQFWLYDLTQNPFMTPRMLCQSLVAAYKTFYDPQNEPRYTQSAIDLSYCESMRDNINKLSQLLLECGRTSRSWTRAILETVQLESDGFDQMEYMDLFSFYDTLEGYCDVFTRTGLISDYGIKYQKSLTRSSIKSIAMPKKRSKGAIKTHGRRLKKTAKKDHAMRSEKRQKLRRLMDEIVLVVREGKNIIEEMAPYNVTGLEHNRSRGIGIYFPFQEQGIHPSYLKTNFYRDTLWGQVIRLLHG